MASVNKVIIVGNLGRDPEVRYMPDGAALANASVATTFRWKDKQSGEQKEETEWHRVTFRGRLAEIAGEYLKKGSPVYVEGRLRTRKWQDQSGQDRYTTEIMADQMQLLGSRGGPGGGGGEGGSRDDGDWNSSSSPSSSAGSRKSAPAKPSAANDIAEMDDDIPF